MTHLSLLLSCLAFVLAGLQAPLEPSPGALARQSPMTVHLMTVLDEPGILGGVRVRVPALEVRQVVAPRVVVVSAPRIVGIDRTYRPMFGFDQLLVLLPEAARLSRGQVINVTGEVRTLGAARSIGLPVDERSSKARKEKAWLYADRAPVLVADAVDTADGVPLVGSNRRAQ